MSSSIEDEDGPAVQVIDIDIERILADDNDGSSRSLESPEPWPVSEEATSPAADTEPPPVLGEEEDDELVLFNMYQRLFRTLDDFIELVQQRSHEFEQTKGQLLEENFDKSRRRYVPVTILLERFERMRGSLTPVADAARKAKREIRNQDRHDAHIFYPENYGKFRDSTYRHLASPPVTIAGSVSASFTCTVCGDSAESAVAIQRRCVWCEGHTCACKEFVMCSKCSVKWYWRSTRNFTKSFATCPICRAEYCLEDIITYNLSGTGAAELQRLREEVEQYRRQFGAADAGKRPLDEDREQPEGKRPRQE